MDTGEAMRWLEQLPGIGRKIAAGVMNASALDLRALVLDSHHRRILQRMGLVPSKVDTARAFDGPCLSCRPHGPPPISTSITC